MMYFVFPLDFLPVKCDACGNIFCKDHFSYITHDCPQAPLKDYQVPVCPLCNEPVATKRDQLPDITVSLHIDNECQDDRAKKKRKNANKCTLKGCKNKALIPVLCSECKLNFCLRHRHPSDHSCNPREARIPAHLRETKTDTNSTTLPSSSSSSSSWIGNFRSKKPVRSSKCSEKRERGQEVSSLTNQMSEDEALARAITASLDSSTSTFSVTRGTLSLQEEEDRMMAEAIAASEREAQTSNTRNSHEQKCSMS